MKIKSHLVTFNNIKTLHMTNDRTIITVTEEFKYTPCHVVGRGGKEIQGKNIRQYF